ncbi:hypothetical protein M0804_014351 [Polistes exclamans]|nr:hypothetical protein M0804_014351 [Polistes exclamans]
MNKTSLKTINGMTQTDGLVTIKIKIFEIEKEVDVFVVKSDDFKDFLIWLNMIKLFRLTQDENLKISQKLTENETKTKIEKKSSTEIKINFNEHIQEKDFKVELNHLRGEENYKIEKLIDKYKMIFAKDKYDVGTVKNYEIRIDLLLDKYCSKRPYRCTIEDKKEIEQQVARLLEEDLIEESYSPFAAPHEASRPITILGYCLLALSTDSIMAYYFKSSMNHYVLYYMFIDDETIDFTEFKTCWFVKQ